MKLSQIDIHHIEIRCPSCNGTMVAMVGRESWMTKCCHCHTVLGVNLVIKTKPNNILFTFDVRAYQEIGAPVERAQLPENANVERVSSSHAN